MEVARDDQRQRVFSRERIDAHVHLWQINEEEFSWLDPENASNVRRDFLTADLSTALASASVDAAIVVQACRRVAETEWLLECAAASEEICGVVGWVPLMDAGLPTILDRLASRPKLVGIREIVQGQAAGFMDQPAFQSGVGLLSNYGLAYDLLLHEGQLVEATRLVDRYPNQRFVLDHAAKPRIAAGEIEPWGGALRELARRENVVCKLSGLVTEAVWKDWSLETLRPYLDVCVQSFGANRLLAGTDWPVCLLASSYVGWWGVLAEYFSAFSGAEKQGIFGANTLAAYRVAS